MRIAAVLLAAALLLVAPGTARAATGDPWVAYVANSVVTKASAPSAVILRADPATGALVEISRNGSQGALFSHPYDIAVARDGSLLVADMGEFATPGDRAADGRIVRVDPVSGRQSVLTEGNFLVDPAGLTLAPDGRLYVLENVGTGGQPGVVAVDLATGGQTLVTQGQHLCYPFGIASQADGTLLVTNFGDFSDGTTTINCTYDNGALVEVDPVAKDQAVLSRNASEWGNLFRNPLGVTVEPGGRILVVNQNGATAVMSVDPASGEQDAETPNTAGDRLVLPQRLAPTPDGSVLVSDFLLDDFEGGLVSVALPGGGQSLMRQDRQLFNNPLGVAVVANRAPVAVLSASPAVVRGGREVTLDASGSTDPEGLALRYAWDLDGDGSFETGTGTVATLAQRLTGTTSFPVRVQVSDPHGASAVADAPVSVDSIRPVLGRLAYRGGRLRYRLSEAARVTFTVRKRVVGKRAVRKRAGRERSAGERPTRKRVQRRKLRVRWRKVRVLRDSGERGPNARRIARRRLVRAKPGRYRVTAVALDAVGNRSTARRLAIKVTRRSLVRRRR